MTDSTVESGARLSLGLRVSWAAGGLGTTIMLYVANLLLLFFMVTELGVPAALAGTVLLVARGFDAFADIIVGALSDRTDSRWGRRRPWMAAGAILCPLAVLALFAPPLVPGAVGAAVQVGIVMVVFFSGYSMFSVPCTAMSAEMTERLDERTSLMAYRTVFLQIAGLVAASGAPALVARLGGGRSAYTATGAILAVIVAVSLWTTVFGVAGARGGQVQARRVAPPGEWFSSLVRNRPYALLVTGKFFAYLSLAANGAVGLFFMTDLLEKGPAGWSRLTLTNALVGIAAVPIWRWLALRAGKRRLYIAAGLISIGASLSWSIAVAGDPDWTIYLRGVLFGFSSTGSLLMTLSMLPDAIAHDFKQTGLRREGIYSALAEFLQKAAYAVGPFLVGLFLSANGYVSSMGTAALQSPRAVYAIRLTMSLLPAVALGVALVIMSFYPIGEADSAGDRV